jgi:hypothetical protein
LRGERKITEGWRAEAHIVRKQAQFELELRLSKEGSEPARRILRAASCAALADAAAVLTALALEPRPTAAGSPSAEPPQLGPSAPATTGAVAAGETLESAPEPTTQAATAERAAPPRPAAQEASQTDAETIEIEEPEIRPAADSGRRIGVGLSAGARFDAGMLPAPRPGLQARVELRVLRIRAGLGISWLPPIDGVPDAYPAASVRSSAILGDGWLGIAVLDGRLSLSPCAVLESGGLSLASLRIREPDERTFLWTAVGAGARASYRIFSGFELGLDAAGLAPFSRPRLWVRADEGDVTLFHAAAVAVRLSVSIGYVFE